jgi:hypothetical protein
MPGGENGGRSWGTVAAVLGSIAALVGAAVGVAQLAKDGGGDASPPATSPADSSQPSGQSDGEGGSQPTLDEWAREAAELCSRYRDEVNSIGAPDPTNPGVNASILDQVSAALSRFRDELDALPVPPEREREIANLTAVIDQELSNGFKAAATAYRNGDDVAYQNAIAEVERLSTREGQLWLALGVRSCATQ